MMRFCLILAIGLASVNAATIYNEAISGDLSNSGLAPTALAVAPGSNQIFGATGRGSTGIERDYFTITIPSGLELAAITVLPGTQSGGAVSFIGVQAGNQVTVSVNAVDATGLLGWWHYSPADINTNILPEMGISLMGSTGFTAPLPAGSYFFWVQDFNTGTFSYGFDLTVTQTPEPASCLLLITGVLSVALIRDLTGMNRARE